MFYFLAASLPREEALAGALARALIQSISNEALGGQRLKSATLGSAVFGTSISG